MSLRQNSSAALLRNLKVRRKNSEILDDANLFLDPKTSSLSKISVHQQPSTISDLSNYTFKLLNADSLKGNENILNEFIQSQLKSDYENSESTLSSNNI